ncbi:unnamed protein product (macronuclear) [Paramecium tetraurelia]|uniref:Uncharacterized protein n=1 Tax=Paramecium tetraurelia TaxID=5888 RepID=A0CWE1_PARTE|nr:uncharacterized protein GSPATT00001310001 [Paramecium tetraurelia]CAK75108.1 unnamed protein product [Paramecium tetraurelia]|eukprot:XP_001442505.1 hypothetical protein (macronuclear) [Paramecium tetraurelia strain d4-2]
MNQLNESVKELTEYQQPEYKANIVDLNNQGKQMERVQERIADVEQTPKKETNYSQEMKSGKKDDNQETRSLVQQQGQEKQWIIKQTMFVRINSKKNVSEFYTIKEMIGQGGFGKVYKVVHRQTGMIRAMKLILKSKLKKEDQEKLLEETSILMDIDHPNIVKLYEMYQDDNSYFLISEYCDGGELFEKIKFVLILTEKEIASYMKQILSAVSYCHSKGIVHRDLKPENILFDSKNQGAALKIIDFGASAKLVNDEKLNKRIGTPFYVAPEVLNGSYDEKCDIWSLGVLLYILLCGYPPFFGHSEGEVLAKVRKGTYQFDSNDWSRVSMQAKDLIRRMLFYDPSARINASEAQQHAWISNNKAKGQVNNLSLKRLQDFDSKNKLKYAILQFITVQVVSSQEKDDLLKIFQDIDKNGDGTVSKEELLAAYLKIYKGDALAAQHIVEELFPQLDANKSGKVDFSEFVTASINRDRTLSKKKIEQSFKLFDLDGNGYITKQEINELFGNEIDEKMWEDILKDCDTNKDGMISLNEFITLLESKIQQNPKLL